MGTFSVQIPRAKCTGVKPPQGRNTFQNHSRLPLTLSSLFVFGVQRESWNGPRTRKRRFHISTAVSTLCSWFTAACSLAAVLGKISLLLHRPKVALQCIAISLFLVFYSLFLYFQLLCKTLVCNGYCFCTILRSTMF